jgi:hypothetical protein
MPLPKFAIDLKHGIGEVLIDGQALHGVRSVTIQTDLNKPTTVTLEILAQEVTFSDDEVRIVIVPTKR